MTRRGQCVDYLQLLIIVLMCRKTKHLLSVNNLS